MNNRTILIGPMGGGSIPDSGASMKNYQLANRLRELNVTVLTVDTGNWKRNPFILIKLLILLLFNARSNIIISANNLSSYRLLRIIRCLPGKRSVFYWVIGGSIANWIADGKVKKRAYEIVKFFLVEGLSMKSLLNQCGFNNVIYVPNFKKIDYLPCLNKSKDSVCRFLFLSRITESKGCDIILQAASILNKHYSKNYTIDFYGKVDDNYTNFHSEIAKLSNVNYKGFIDLRNTSNYDILSSYDVMLFPTFWHGEGFPGILIDAFICGLPVIASDWHFNGDILINNETGFLIKPQNTDALVNAMETVIKDKKLIDKMSIKCQLQAKQYDTVNVVTEQLLKGIGLK